MAKIIFSNNFNQTEYLRTLARMGLTSFAVRVMNEIDICTYVLEHGSSLPNGRLISSKEADYIFNHLTNSNYTDSKNLRSAIDSFRDCVIGDITKPLEDYLSEDFLEKKELIKKYYKAYTVYKQEHDLYDKHDLINFILQSDIHIEEECFYYEEYGISKLFLEMIEHVFKSVNCVSLNETFKAKENDIHFMKAYGKPCEADYIFSEIKKHPIDECQIVLTNTSDSLEIVKTMEMLNIPYTSHIGTPIISTKAGILLNLLFNLEKNSYGIDGYKTLFNCPAFNSDILKAFIPEDNRNPDYVFSNFVKYAGWLRLNFNSKASDIHSELYQSVIANMLLKLQESLSKGIAEFINEYILEPTPFDEQVIEKIRNIEQASKEYGFDKKDVLLELLDSSINKKVSQSGHLYLTDIGSAISSLRKYTFIIGLTSDYPGGPKENYLIFDEEYQKTDSSLYLSQEIVKRKERVLRSLINASEEIYLTYPYFDLASLEDKNPSSILFDLYQGGDISNMPSYGYKDLQLDINKEVYSARLDNLKSDLPSNSITLSYDKNIHFNKVYSPSMFYQFFMKEHYLSFLLSCILDISADEEDDPYVVIPRNELGTLIHKVMERFDKNKTSLDDLLVKAEKEFDKFLLKKPPMIPSSAVKAKENYLRLVISLYKIDPGNTHVFSERKVQGGIDEIVFCGTADRLEKDQFGNYILVDYKTGINILHKQDDPVTCLQGLIYAYFLENYASQIGMDNIVVKRIEFRYPEREKTISIDYNSDTKQALLDLVNQFKTCIENGQLFIHLDGEQKYVDKYAHLLSLMKGAKSL